MNVIDLMVDGFKRVYSGTGKLTKHILLFLITGIVSISSVYVQTVAETMEKTKELGSLNGLLVCLLITLIIGVYMGGYNLLFSHNSFNNEKEYSLPEINIKPFKVFFDALPLMIVWTLYVFAAIGIAFAFLVSHSFLIVLGIFLILAVLFICAFIQFIYIAYTKNFNKKGLYNIVLPFGYIKHTFSDFVLLGLLFIPVYSAAMTPSFIVGLMMGLTGVKNVSAAMYAGGILGGYLSFVVQLVWYYCLVQIYKEKIEPNM